VSPRFAPTLAASRSRLPRAACGRSGPPARGGLPTSTVVQSLVARAKDPRCGLRWQEWILSEVGARFSESRIPSARGTGRGRGASSAGQTFIRRSRESRGITLRDQQTVLPAVTLALTTGLRGTKCDCLRGGRSIGLRCSKGRQEPDSARDGPCGAAQRASVRDPERVGRSDCASRKLRSSQGSIPRAREDITQTLTDTGTAGSR
jgi:hypothetical protein